MSFARYSSDEIMVVAANFNNFVIDCYVNLKMLKYIFTNFEDSQLKFQKEDLINPQAPKEYFSCHEMVNRRHNATIKPYFTNNHRFESLVWKFKTVNISDHMILENSYKHLISKLNNNQIISSNLITNKIVSLVKNSHSVE